MRHISDRQRRARLARRHAVAPAHRVADAEAATRAMVVLHATEPATVYLSVHARVDSATVADVDTALYTERTLVKQLAMRRTLFLFPRDLLAAAWGSAAVRVAEFEGKRMAKDVELAGVAADGAAWVQRARQLVLDEIATRPEGMTAVEIREALPEVAVRFDVTAGTVWNHSRVLTHLGLTGDIVRGTNTQHWRLSRPRWTATAEWLGAPAAGLAADAGYVELVSRWLARFGPGTEDDLVWWLGATKGAVRAALVTIGAEQVSLDGGLTGYVLPSDGSGSGGAGDDGTGSGGAGDDDTDGVEPWAALLPVLDPTVMGWRDRAWYLGGHGRQLFDRNGNAGTTAWWDGRVVGCWVQDADGVVQVRLLERLPGAARRALAVEAERLTAWLDGVRIGTVYPSPAVKAVDWVDP